MIVFVDYEHGPEIPDADVTASGWRRQLLAARTWITYRLEDLADQPCMLVRYDRITPELLREIDARAIFISGNGTDPATYDPALLAPLADIVRAAALPTFGFCGGFQFITSALGADLRPLDVDPNSELASTLINFPNGQLAEFGYLPVELVADHPLLADLEPAPIVRHAHALEVPQLPDGFTLLASTQITTAQMAVDDERRIVGTQFHPEYYTDEHPAGRVMIRNFLHWAGITS